MAMFSIANTTAIGAGQAQQAIAATYKTLVAVAASSAGGATVGAMLRRGKIYDLVFGTAGIPADNAVEFDLTRATIGATVSVAGSVSSISSALMLDTADAGFVSYALINSSNEGNISATTESWYLGTNQRASYRWVANPLSEIVYPAVSSGTGGNGLALRARSVGYTGTATGTLFVNEL
jgi:hypothetical protein